MSAYAMTCSNILPPLMGLTTEKEARTNSISERTESLPGSTEAPDTENSAWDIVIKSASLDLGHFVRSTSKALGTTREQRRGGARTYDPNSTPADDAVLFELTITYYGRKYTVKRSYPRFVQLRNELIRELNSGSRRRVNKTTELPELPFSIINQLNSGGLSPSPEIDISGASGNFALSTEHIPASHAGWSFTMLQAFLNGYCPTMERWLRNVIKVVHPETSAALALFLEEPVNDNIVSSSPVRRKKMYTVTGRGSSRSLRRQSSSLLSISEDSICQ